MKFGWNLLADIEIQDQQSEENMEHYGLLAQNYTIREEMFGGRTHYVLPVVMMTSGVHAGSHGPLFHDADELGKFPASWDGIPVAIQHPVDESGTPVSCNQPSVLDEQVVGRVFNTHLDNGKLRAEAWIDPELITRIAPEALEHLKKGMPMDVSVGVFTEDDMMAGEWNGEQYIGVARNHRPDHLALLPGATGACSWNDGCGVRAHQEGMQDNFNPNHDNAGRFASGTGTGGQMARDRAMQRGNQPPGSRKDSPRDKFIGKEGYPSQKFSNHMTVEVFTGKGGNEEGVLKHLRPGDLVGGDGRAIIHFSPTTGTVAVVSNAVFKQHGESPQKISENNKIKKQHIDKHSIAEIGVVHFRQGPPVYGMQTNAINYKDTEPGPWSKPMLSDFGVSGQWQSLSQEDKAMVAGHFLIGDDAATNYGELMFPVVNPKTGKLNEAALRAVISGRGAQANITAAQRISARRQAYRLLNEEFDAALEVPKTMEMMIQGEHPDVKELAAEGYMISINEMSHQETAGQIQGKLDRMDDDTKMHFLVECYPDYFIYRVKARSNGGISPGGGSGEGELYRRDYKSNDKDEIEFTGEAQPVVKKTEYVNTNEGGHEMPKNNPQPCCEEKVQMLIEAGLYSEDHRERLLAMEEADIDILTASIDKVSEMTSKVTALEGEVNTLKANVAQTTTREQAIQTLKSELKDPDKFMALLPQEHQSSIRHGLGLYRQERDQKIGHILANTDVYTKERLDAMQDQDLDDLARAIKVPNDFSLNGPLPQVNRGGHADHAVYPPGVE